MEAFFIDVLDDFLSPAFLERVRQKFHYGDAQEDEFQAVAEEMLPLIHDEAFWEKEEYFVKNQHQVENSDVIYENVIMSLGKGLDGLQESYSDRGMLSQSYMLEVLAGELLLKGYEAYNRYIRKNTDWHVARYHFPGSEKDFPIEILPSLLKRVAPQITCNPAFCMLPKKSVVFISELTKDEKLQCKGICVGCNNIRCPNRMADDCLAKKLITRMADMPLTYGFRRIFGEFSNQRL